MYTYLLASYFFIEFVSLSLNKFNRLVTEGRSQW